jgi:uncharacterized OB-fold protein
MRTSITPRLNPETEGFWEGCRAGELRAQRCGECGRLRFPPQPMCPACNSMARSWTAIADTGRISSFSVVTGEGPEPMLPGTEAVPYAVAVVELDAGIRMVTDIDAAEIEHLTVGAPVTAAFERISDEVSLPRFVPDGGPPGDGRRLELGQLHGRPGT